MQLGQRIKQRRKELKLSQRALAQRVGLTPGFLSQIEHNLITPSIDSLREISKVLDVPLSDSGYLVETDAKTPVVRHNKRLKLTLPGSDIVFELLTSDLKQPMDVFMVELKPEDGNLATLLSPQSTEDCLYVTEGQLEIKLGEKTHLLSRGDSIYFEGVFLRRLIVTGDQPARFIIAITPSIF
jgi:transcriptional regulator with XRE-family HTH domain